MHLAAVSRVVWGERDPNLCWTTNVEGTRNVLEGAKSSRDKPWVIVASSREVYGEPPLLPASEDTPLAPVNVYGRSKVAAELLAKDAQAAGARVAVVRFSNVYGSAADHADRVVPCLVRSALQGAPLRVEGSENTFDFTHVSDAVAGILAVMRALESGQALPPIHFVTGRPTTLAELARIAIHTTQSTSVCVNAPSREFDVSRFYGDGARAKQLLGWSPRVAIEDGIAMLADEMRKEEQ